MTPKEFSKANNGADDVFLCEYEYDIHCNTGIVSSVLHTLMMVKRIVRKLRVKGSGILLKFLAQIVKMMYNMKRNK